MDDPKGREGGGVWGFFFFWMLLPWFFSFFLSILLFFFFSPSLQWVGAEHPPDCYSKIKIK